MPIYQFRNGKVERTDEIYQPVTQDKKQEQHAKLLIIRGIPYRPKVNRNDENIGEEDHA